MQKKVLDCDTCNAELNLNGKVVFGEGDLNADLFLCGEAPGAEEEEVGSPFIGPAGELLMKILSAMGLKREQVYLGNILNWRPKAQSGIREQTAEAGRVGVLPAVPQGSNRDCSTKGDSGPW